MIIRVFLYSVFSCFLVKLYWWSSTINISSLSHSFRDHFYQFGEIRSVNVVSKQQCAFVQFTTRASAEAAAEKSFNKLIINGRRLNIKWGRSQGQQLAPRPQTGEGDVPLEPVPGLPGGKSLDFEHALEGVPGSVPHSSHRFPAPPSKFCPDWLSH